MLDLSRGLAGGKRGESCGRIKGGHVTAVVQDALALTAPLCGEDKCQNALTRAGTASNHDELALPERKPQRPVQVPQCRNFRHLLPAVNTAGERPTRCQHLPKLLGQFLVTSLEVGDNLLLGCNVNVHEVVRLSLLASLGREGLLPHDPHDRVAILQERLEIVHQTLVGEGEVLGELTTVGQLILGAEDRHRGLDPILRDLVTVKVRGRNVFTKVVRLDKERNSTLVVCRTEELGKGTANRNVAALLKCHLVLLPLSYLPSISARRAFSAALTSSRLNACGSTRKSAVNSWTLCAAAIWSRIESPSWDSLSGDTFPPADVSATS